MDKNFKDEFAKLIEQLRTEANQAIKESGKMSFRDFAKVIEAKTGQEIGYNALTSWANKNNEPKRDNLETIALYMGITYTDLIIRLTGEVPTLNAETVSEAIKGWKNEERTKLLKELLEKAASDLSKEEKFELIQHLIN